MKLPYWTRSRGTGGRIESPEDFFVREILHRKYFARYKAGKGVSRLEGKYNLFLLRKRNMTTHRALEIISKKFRNRNIGFAGLKDKFAVTEQYITMAGGSDFREGGESSVELAKAGTTDRMLSKGDLLGNEFSITLHGCRTQGLPRAAEELNSHGVPNYFGPQRFGRRGDNHVIGRLLVKRDFRKALLLINKSGRRYGDIFHVPKEKLKFFINAYQSRLFNEMLGEYVRKKKYFAGWLPVAGCNTRNTGKAMEILKKEGVKPRDFMLSELRLACAGGRRKAFIKTPVEYRTSGSSAKLRFTLPSGSYATVVLKEVCKCRSDSRWRLS